MLNRIAFGSRVDCSLGVGSPEFNKEIAVSEYKLEVFSNETTLSKVWRAMTLFAIAALVVTAVVLTTFCASKDSGITRFLAISWLVAPPAWFVFENAFLLKPEDVEQLKGRMARFRLGQDAARMAWFGIAALIIYFTEP